MMIDFTEEEINTVKQTVGKRWNSKEIQLADINFAKTDDEKPVPYPALVWEDKKSTFVVLKLAIFTYKNFFYHAMDSRFDAGVDEYNDLGKCVDDILKAQADFLLSMSSDNIKINANKDMENSS